VGAGCGKSIKKGREEGQVADHTFAPVHASYTSQRTRERNARISILVQHSVLLQMFRNSTRQALRFQPVLREQPTLIPVRAITKDRRDGLARTKLLSELVRSHDVQSRASTDIETFGVEEIIYHLDRLFVWDVQRPIDVGDECSQVIGDASLADTLHPSLFSRALGSREEDREQPSVIELPLLSFSVPPVCTYECNTLPGGSANQTCVFPSLFSFKNKPTPASVPPVPVAQVKASRFP
jgi:hypothetical protein